MSRHKHADKIIAKAENMDLVICVKLMNAPDFDWMEAVNNVHLPYDEERDYFLCLEKHKEACLHWLNGGEIQYLRSLKSTWGAVESIGDSYENEADHIECSIDDLENFNPTEWGYDSIFMRDDFELRIKPRKEKRWIAISNATGVPVNRAFKSALDAVNFIKCDLSMCSASDFQFIEIEIEAIYEQLKFPPTRKA